MASPGHKCWGALLAFSEQWLRMPGAPPIRMTSKCAAGWRVGETLFIIIQAQSPFYIQAQSFLHGFNIFSIFQECNYVHKSQEGYSVLFRTSQFQKTMPPMAALPAEPPCIMLVSLWAGHAAAPSVVHLHIGKHSICRL